MLTGVILTLFIMLLLCTIFTNQDAASVSKLKARQPDKIQYLDDGMVLLSFNINRNENSRGSLVFFTSHQHVTVFTKNNVIYNWDDSGGIWGHTTGNVWNFVKLPAYTETVIVRLKPCYPETAGQIEQYYIECIYSVSRFFYHVLLGVYSQQQPYRRNSFLSGDILHIAWTLGHQ